MRSISIVVPIYHEEATLPAFHSRILELICGLEETYQFEIIYVNDGSTDRSLEIMQSYQREDPRIRIINFTRNFGHQLAITAGIDHSKGDACVIIDGDLQDPPEVIAQFIEEWEKGYYVVYGKRRKRKGESHFKLITARYFYRVLNLLTDYPIPVDAGDFRLIDRRVVNKLREFREESRYIRGIIHWMGYRTKAVEYDRDKRYAGKTKYSLKKMIRFALDGITSFSDKPLKIASHMGLLIMCIALGIIVYVVIGKIFYPKTTIPGWASLMVVMLFLGGMQLLFLGIIGQYIGRVYRDVKKRPLYIIDEIYE